MPKDRLVPRSAGGRRLCPPRARGSGDATGRASASEDPAVFVARARRRVRGAWDHLLHLVEAQAQWAPSLPASWGRTSSVGRARPSRPGGEGPDRQLSHHAGAAAGDWSSSGTRPGGGCLGLRGTGCLSRGINQPARAAAPPGISMIVETAAGAAHPHPPVLNALPSHWSRCPGPCPLGRRTE